MAGFAVSPEVLWSIAETMGYRSGLWATYKQWQELGAQVRKGEKSANIVFWKFFDREALISNEDENLTSRRIPMAREYCVFNAEQVHGYSAAEEEAPPQLERIQSAENFFAELGTEIRQGGNNAYYDQAVDAVYMPPFAAFQNPLAYYGVLAHETTHWTGSKARLNRDMTGRFRTAAYAIEELIAELGAAFLCAELSLVTSPRTDHAPYIASWLSVLKNDKKAIFSAAAKAQEAVDWMMRRGSAIEEAA